MPTRPEQHTSRRDQHDARDATRPAGRAVRDRSPVVEWIGYHLGELFGTTVTAGLAVTVSGWFALATLVIAAGWATHELRLRRHRRALTAAYRPVITGPDRATTSDTAPEAGPAPGIDRDSHDTKDNEDTERRAER